MSIRRVYLYDRSLEMTITIGQNFKRLYYEVWFHKGDHRLVHSDCGAIEISKLNKKRFLLALFQWKYRSRAVSLSCLHYFRSLTRLRLLSCDRSLSCWRPISSICCVITMQNRKQGFRPTKGQGRSRRWRSSLRLILTREDVNCQFASLSRLLRFSRSLWSLALWWVLLTNLSLIWPVGLL